MIQNNVCFFLHFLHLTFPGNMPLLSVFILFSQMSKKKVFFYLNNIHQGLVYFSGIPEDSTCVLLPNALTATTFSAI